MDPYGSLVEEAGSLWYLCKVEVCRGIWKLMEASTEYIHGSCN